ncbi:hypothetical protein DICVIV_08680 [Dictyocaulus viviparus]|uniref:Thrombospondin type 1 domain protein n=1 Tax=Dictyocaulus viviparus TaxID=29172 RepID=A0A0D8XNA5_DICVI|nr:hypothetical protein DICVIV_08680 [Dictyocaulus viviparus]
MAKRGDSIFVGNSTHVVDVSTDIFWMSLKFDQLIYRATYEGCPTRNTPRQVKCETLNRTSRETICGGEEILSKQQCEVVCKMRKSGNEFLWRMADGIPCQTNADRAVCSQGTCQVVGCDDVIGSSLRFDVCGVCGGRGDTCDSSQFVWKDSGEFTKCSTTCTDLAKGFHIGEEEYDRKSRSIVVCINARTGRVVPERLCADRERPAIRTKPCPPLICPSRYVILNRRNFSILRGCKDSAKIEIERISLCNRS